MRRLASRSGWAFVALTFLGCGRSNLLAGIVEETAPGPSAGGDSTLPGTGGATTGGFGTGGTMEALVIGPDPLPEARLEAPYSVQLTFSSGDEPYVFGLGPQSALPDGLQLSESGQITGTPHEFGAFELTLLVRDSRGLTHRAERILVVRRSRYVGVYTFVSGASTTTAVKLYDLQDRAAPPFTFLPERQLVGGFEFSPDGQMMVFFISTGMGGTRNVELARLDELTAGGETERMIDAVEPETTCEWASESQRVICAVRTTEDDLFELSAIGVSDTGLTFEGQSIKAETIHGFRESGEYFFHEAGAGTLQSVDWEPGGAWVIRDHVATPVTVVSPNGQRAYGPGSEPTELRAYDLVSGSAGTIKGEGIVLSDDQRYVAITNWNSVDGNYEEQHHFLGDVTNPELVAEDQFVDFERGNLGTYRDHFRSDVRIRRRDGKLQVDFLRTTGSVRLTVAGLEGVVASYVLASDNRTLAVETRSDISEPSGPSSRYYLVRLGNGFGATVDEIASGFEATLEFSPTGRDLLLSSPRGAPELGQFRLYRTVPPNTETLFALPVVWAWISWSRDGSYVGILGGNEIDGSRDYYVVDVLAPESGGERLVSCPPTSESDPRCPNAAVFQP